MLNESLLKLSKFSCSAGTEGDQFSIDYILPLKFGDTGMSVVSLKKFFNAGAGTKFDKELKEKLTNWQLAHAKHISLIAGWVNKNFEGDASEIPQMEFELGLVGPATFVAIKLASYDGIYKMKQVNEHYAGYVVKKGDYLGKIASLFGFQLSEIVNVNPQISNINLIRVGEKINIPDHLLDPIAPASEDMTLPKAVQLAYDEINESEAQNIAESPDKDLLLNIPLSDVINEPYKDSENYYCVWNSRQTREEVGEGLDSFIQSNSAKALRQGVRYLFNFYSKRTTWEADLRSEDGIKFESLLKYQNRTEANKQVYTLTIEDIPILEALGISDDENRRVDALAFQNLTEGAKPEFASIVKVVMPDLNVRSTYKFIIAVKSKMFDAIPTEHKKPSEHKKTEKIAYTKSICSGDEIVDMITAGGGGGGGGGSPVYNDNLNLEQFEGVKKKLSTQRELARLNELSSVSTDPQIKEQLKQKVSELNLSEMAEFNERLGDLPFVVLYEISTLEKHIGAVRDMMLGYDKIISETKQYGVKYTPDLSLSDEAEKLSSVLPALRKLCDYNEVNFSNSSEATMAISYKVVRNEDSLSGLEIKSVSIIESSPQIKILDAGMGNFLGSTPISSRTTMTYLALLHTLSKRAYKYRSLKKQNLKIDKKDVLAFPIAYHFPKIKVDFNMMDTDLNTLFGTDIEGFDVSINNIKNYSSDILLKFNLEKNLGIFDKIKLRTFEIESLRDFVVTDALPVNINFNSLDELFTEFFDRYDMLSLFVDFGQLVPDFEVCEPEWDFDFSIPKLPRLPTFDPIREIVKMLNTAIQDLLLSILSSIVRMILKFLKNNGVPTSGMENPLARTSIRDIFPESTAPDFTEMSLQGITGNPSIVNKMRSVGATLGLSEDAISELPNLFDSITDVCTPSEIFELLEGVGTPEINRVILNITKSTCSSLAASVNDPSDITKIVKTIGDFVNPSVKEKLKNFGFSPPLSEAATKIPCPDEIGSGNSDTQIRDTLEKLNASPKEITRAVSAARKRRDSIKNFFKKNPVAAQMPGGANGLAGLPSPYENENMNRLTELAAEGVFGTIEAVFMSEVAGFVPLLYDIRSRFLNRNDANFDHIGMAEYDFVKGQIDSFSTSDNAGQQSLFKPGNIIFEAGESPSARNPFVKSVEPARMLDPLSQEEFKLEFNLADRIDAAYLNEIMMRPMKNTIQEFAVFPEFFQYANDPRTAEVVNYSRSGGSNQDRYLTAYSLKSLTPLRAQTDFESAGFANQKYNIALFDKPYLHTPVDCYELSRTSRIFKYDESTLREKFDYNKPLSPYLSNIIQRTDPHKAPDQPKFLRPEAFAFLVSLQMKNNIDQALERRTYFGTNTTFISREFSEYEIHDDVINPYAFMAQFWSNWERAGVNIFEGHEFKRLPNNDFSHLYNTIAYGDIIAGSGAGQLRKQGAFHFLTQHIMTRIGDSIRNSRFFNLDEIEKLSEKISSRYVEDFSRKNANGETIRCLIKKKGVIDFDEVRKSALRDYKDSLSREEYNPLQRDYSKPGPLENSFTDQLIYLYIKTFIVEFSMKTIFISSRFSLDFMVEQDFIYDYFVDYMLVTLEKEFENSNRYKINFYDQIKKIANLDDPVLALRSLVVKIFKSTKDEIQDISRKLFEPQYQSFQEEYFNSLVAPSSTGHVPELDNRNTRLGQPKPITSPLGQVINPGLTNYICIPNTDEVSETAEDFRSIAAIQDQELKKNTGYFRVETYFYLEDPPEYGWQDTNYIIKALANFAHYIDPEGQESFKDLLYEEGTDRKRIADALIRATSFRMSLRDLGDLFAADYQIAEILASQGRTYPDTFMGKGNHDENLQYYSLRYLLRNHLKVGIRLLYITGRHESDYERYLYEDAPSTFAEVSKNPMSLNSTEPGYTEDIVPDFSHMDPITWNGYYNHTYTAGGIHNDLADQGTNNYGSPFGHHLDSPSIAHAIAPWRALIERMALGPVYHIGHYKESSALQSLEQFLNQTVDGEEREDPYAAMREIFVRSVADKNNSIELANHEISVDCPFELFSATSRNQVAMSAPKRILNAYKDRLYEEFLGLGPRPSVLERQEGAPDIRRLNKDKIVNGTINLLFDDIFPLNRLASLYFINEQNFFDTTGRFNDLLGGTRGSIRSTYRILKNKGTSTSPGEFGIGDKTQVDPSEMYSVISSNMTAQGPSGDVANELMGDFAPQIAKLVASAPIIMIRGQAAALDPGYAAMNKISKDDPCLLKDGPSMLSLKPPPFTFPNRSIDSGTKDQAYAPVTIAGAVDIGLSVALMGNPFTFVFGVKGLKNALTHTFNTFTGDSERKSYGQPLGPLGLLALSMPHLPGESPSRLKREKPCTDGRDDPRRATLTDAQGNIVDTDNKVTDLQRCEDTEE